jgi:hypothetical protein
MYSGMKTRPLYFSIKDTERRDLLEVIGRQAWALFYDYTNPDPDEKLV